MSRQQKRKLLRQLEKEIEQAKKSPLYPVVKAQMEIRRGSDDIQLLQKQILAVQQNPEPILIEYYNYDQEILKVVSSQLRPFLCFEQELDGTISRVRFCNADFMEPFRKGWTASEKDFHHNGETNPTQSQLLIETIKFLNFSIESLGGGFVDVAHIILSKMPLAERKKQRAEFVDYWTKEYGTLRHLLMFEYGSNQFGVKK